MFPIWIEPHVNQDKSSVSDEYVWPMMNMYYAAGIEAALHAWQVGCHYYSAN